MYEKNAKDIKVKYTAQKDEMMKTVTDGINQILANRIREVDNVYNPACQKLSIHAEMISNYVQKVEKARHRTNNALENTKLKDLLSAQKDIDHDTQMLQNLTSSQVQVENPEPFTEDLSFYTMFKELTDKCKYCICYHFRFRINAGIFLNMLYIVYICYTCLANII